MTNNIPQRIIDIVGENVKFEVVDIGCSQNLVYRIKDNYYLKISSNKNDLLRNEADRIKWLQNKLPVPCIIDYFEDKDEKQYLLTSALLGTMAHLAVCDIPNTVRLLANGLRQFHCVSIIDCPFDETSKTKGYKTDDLVLTHGDYCLPNVLIDLQKNVVDGFVDLGQVGICDRLWDFALVKTSLERNFGNGEKWFELLWREYGLKEEPDREKIEYYQMLDALS
ncbi:unnamed protein product [Didymodactylos carnosus]|uniref:Aminoglycoside phosphotransferase domain-containing protein n=1 Tax=Didymodactylos carnosus TaxID=1234261 RepID=A0A815VD55_9BILA|nr:unnamed protein product [Didymodactylos carnosus]CAF1533388.1 unnamed protein product [Didymodactylos carnosus]CAF4214238.1 unnamed protein product [Didymodactylos carnosus]CAF4392985.1 unnamed protein product [Didymodactylos carnosus]